MMHGHVEEVVQRVDPFYILHIPVNSMRNICLVQAKHVAKAALALLVDTLHMSANRADNEIHLKNNSIGWQLRHTHSVTQP